MGLDVYMKSDLVRHLDSAQVALELVLSANQSLDPERTSAYEQGFVDALRVLACAWGLRRPGRVGHTLPRDASVWVLAAQEHSEVKSGSFPVTSMLWEGGAND